MMAISFNQIPNNLRVPFTFVEFDNSRAQQGPSIQPYKILVIGQRLAAGSVAELVPTLITSEAQAREAFGAGSILHGMLAAYLDNDKQTELLAIAQDDDGAAVDATGKITIAAGTATADGVLAVYVGGRRIAVAVADGDDQDAVATALAAAITAEPLSYVSAVVNGVNANEVDLTAKNGGELGNQIDVRLNYGDSDAFPDGITATVTAMASGAGNPDVDDVLSILPDEQYNLIVHGYTDSINLGKLDVELADRFGPLRQIDGVAITAKTDSLANLSTLGNGQNSKHLVILGSAGPTAPWEWAAAMTGQISVAAQADPARPFQTLPLVGILAPDSSELFKIAERNILLFDGIATFRMAGNQPVIERVITTWQLNGAGAPDSSYLDLNTLLTLSFLRFDFRNTMLARYPRHKLASDGTRFGSGQAIITPQIGRAEAINKFSEWETAGLVEGLAQFERDLVVERNAASPNRLDFLLPPDLSNQLRVVGAQIQFLL